MKIVIIFPSPTSCRLPPCHLTRWQWSHSFPSLSQGSIPLSYFTDTGKSLSSWSGQRRDCEIVHIDPAVATHKPDGVGVAGAQWNRQAGVALVFVPAPGRRCV